jgi:hypothetical protein
MQCISPYNVSSPVVFVSKEWSQWHIYGKEGLLDMPCQLVSFVSSSATSLHGIVTAALRCGHEDAGVLCEYLAGARR